MPASRQTEQMQAEVDEIKSELEDFGPEGFFAVPYTTIRRDFPCFTKHAIEPFIKSLGFATAEQIKDDNFMNAAWKKNELLMDSDWPILIAAAERYYIQNKEYEDWGKIIRDFGGDDYDYDVGIDEGLLDLVPSGVLTKKIAKATGIEEGVGTAAVIGAAAKFVLDHKDDIINGLKELGIAANDIDKDIVDIIKRHKDLKQGDMLLGEDSDNDEFDDFDTQIQSDELSDPRFELSDEEWNALQKEIAGEIPQASLSEECEDCIDEDIEDDMSDEEFASKFEEALKKRRNCCK